MARAQLKSVNGKRKPGPSALTHRGGSVKRLPGLTKKESAALKDAISIHDVNTKFKPPEFLNIIGVKMWVMVFNKLAEVHEITENDLPGMEALCYMRQKMYKKMCADQDISPNENNAYRRALIEYGMTPASMVMMDHDGKKRLPRVGKHGKPLDLPQANPDDDSEDSADLAELD